LNNQKELTEALNGLSREIVAKVLDLLEVANCNQKLCNLVRDTIYDSKNKFELRILGERKKENDYKKDSQKNSLY